LLPLSFGRIVTRGFYKLKAIAVEFTLISLTAISNQRYLAKSSLEAE